MSKFLSLIGLLACVFALHLAFRYSESPIKEVRTKYLEDLGEIQLKTESFHKVLTADGREAENLVEAFKELRYSFKKAEFLLDYLEPQDVRDHLNGAPLPKTERNAPRLVVLEPKGLQRMEELVYADSIPYQELVKLSKEFNYQFGQIYRFAHKIPFDDRQVFEALRLGLIRLMSLGITGFDTPASDQAIVESRMAWQSMASYAKYYLELAEDRKLASKITSLLKEGSEYLAESDFDEFNRADFIRDCLHPLYGDYLDLHHHLAFETAAEVYSGELPINYESRDIFNESFFNLTYYTGLNTDSESYTAQKRLGRFLFYDPILSGDQDRSCASCHNPNKAYSDGLAKSLAKGGGTLSRNSPGLFNALYSDRFFYDLRADRMETQMEHVIFSAEEFDSDYQSIFKRLKESEHYQSLFNQAFPSTNSKINRSNLSQAIMAFLSDLSSFNSPVDQYLRGESVVLSNSEKQGLNLFMGKAACATCHFAPAFNGMVPPWYEEGESEVLGVLRYPGANEIDEDLGRYKAGVVSDEAPFFKHSFKTVGLRNVAYTAPYFHNGAYKSLREVLDFYNHGGAAGIGIDLENQTLPPDSLGLNEAELRSLEDFLHALSDTSNTVYAPEMSALD